MRICRYLTRTNLSIRCSRNNENQDFKKEQGLESKETMKPQDRAQLEAKKMTLHLDLTSDQQSKVEAILLNHYTEGKAKRDSMKKTKKPSEEERLAMRNDMLDAQIELKREMKGILNAEQYEKYEKMQGRRLQKGLKKEKQEQKGR